MNTEDTQLITAGNVELIRAELKGRLAEPDQRTLWRRFGVGTQEAFVEEFFDEVTRLRTPDVSAGRLTAEIQPVVECVLKDGLGIRRYDEVSRTTGWMFANEHDHARVFRHFECAAGFHPQLVDSVLADVIAMLGLHNKPVVETATAIQAQIEARRKELQAARGPKNPA